MVKSVVFNIFLFISSIKKEEEYSNYRGLAIKTADSGDFGIRLPERCGFQVPPLGIHGSPCRIRKCLRGELTRVRQFKWRDLHPLHLYASG